MAQMGGSGRMRYQQEMPPPGGYAEVFWHRTWPRTWATSRRLFGCMGAVIAYGYVVFVYQKRRVDTHKLEDVDIKCATEPFILAERDRNWLRLLRRNRALEDEVMADVPGWQTGTWYGEPIYYTLGDGWWDPNQFEAFVHAPRTAHNRWLEWRDHSEYCAPKWYDKYQPEFTKGRIW